MDYKISVDIFAGFKGSGKTCFINKLYPIAWSKEKTLIIQNEKGIESLKISDLSGNTESEEITGGCICCSANAILESTILKAVEEFKPERIVLELAETANLKDVRDLFSKTKALQCEIKRVFYLVNAVDFYRRMFVSELFLKNQLALIPMLLINRSEKLSKEKTDRILKFIKDTNRDIDIVFQNTMNESEDFLKEVISKSEKESKIEKSPNSFRNLGFDYSDFISG